MIAALALSAVAIATALTTIETPRSDRMIAAAGVTLHIVCAGQRQPGRPLVVLEAGAGNGLSTWNDVLEPIAQFARVCAYDRQNLGSSERVATQPTGAGHTATLHALLGAAHEPPPYVIAGHSYGGMIARLFAMRYPREVAGIVLVDSSHEDQIARFSVLAEPPRPVAPPGRSAVEPKEQANLAATSAELAAAPWHADIPLVVLSRGLWLKTPPPTPDPLASTRLGIWQDLHRELATRSPHGEVVVATHSGHYIQNDEPQIVIDAVRRVVTRVTTHS
jgi:pimeloyl-ACP methyl ester carboxylesterase